MLYQTLLGTWPIEPFADLDDKSAREEYVARIQQYMAKALKEAKLNTSWVQPNEAWDGCDGSISSRKFSSFFAP